MEKQRWEESEKRQGGSRSRLARAAGAEPSGQMRDEKMHAAVARSTFPSQNVQNAPCSEHFWTLTCRKSACRCGAKQIWKSNTPCSEHFWNLSEKVHAVVAPPRKFRSENARNATCSCHFWTLKHRFVWQAQGIR